MLWTENQRQATACFGRKTRDKRLHALDGKPETGLQFASASIWIEEKNNPVMKELNQNSGDKCPWNIDSGQWLSLPVPWHASASQTVFPHWNHGPETSTQRGNYAVVENIGEMASAVDSSNTEDDSTENIKHGIKAEENIASSHPLNFKAVTGEALQEDLIDSDVKELIDVSDAKACKLQGDAAVKDEGICILQDLGLANSDKSASENDSEKESCGGMKEQLSCNASLTMSLGVLPSKDINEEANEQGVRYGTNGIDTREIKENTRLCGTSSISHSQRHIIPRLPLNQHLIHTEQVKAPVRVTRPPGEGRGRNQLLPRYWPRITDQELQQFTYGDSNCTITPLFEKILSASDAGRIGRLVLPKACAEAYFPPISQPEGLPLKIQDVSGKDWVFQFRFWPNNNSRMYVLEGVTSCIQSMNLQAGDTVTFSRLDPEGKLVMGYRRASNSSCLQDYQQGVGSSVGVENHTNISSFSSLLQQSAECCVDMNGYGNLSDVGCNWFISEKACAKAKEISDFQSLAAVDGKRGWHLSCKGKRLRIEVEHPIDLTLSWEETQQLLRPPCNATPTLFTIDGHEFEEYEGPPVFGKRTLFTTRRNVSFGEDQWVQCDDCGSWRKVPYDVFLPTRWICADNVWDPKRATCTAPQEVNSDEIDKLLQQRKDVINVQKVAEPTSGLDALATAATLGGSNVVSSSTPAPTTKHPRHRPGCTCIVCIQPPSGKGPKHKPTCICNVCMTVKRRFKTLMMRRKKRQSEREAEHVCKKRAWVKEESIGATNCQLDNCGFPEAGLKQVNIAGTFPRVVRRVNNLSPSDQQFSPHTALCSSFSSIPQSVGDEGFIGKGQIDLNCQPEREDEHGKTIGRISMIRLLQSATYPLDRYLKQQGLASLICSQQVVTSIGFGRNVGNKKDDELIGNQSTILNPNGPKEEAFFMLSQQEVDNAAIIQTYNDVDKKVTTQASIRTS